MNGNSETALSTGKFRDICRICLQQEENMVDIFESGIVDQVIDITNLKVSLDDKLPKTLCLNCSVQVDCLFKLRQQALSSDTYLRTLLENEKCDEAENEKCDEAENVKCDEVENVSKVPQKQRQLKKKKRQRVRKKKNTKSLVNDQMYLIIVPEVDVSDCKENSEIFIKDLNHDSDDGELSQFCKNLYKNSGFGHTYEKHPVSEHSENDFSKSETEPMDEESQYQSESVSTDKIEPVQYTMFKKNKVFNVNVAIFKCDMCKESYEDITDLGNHYIVKHDKGPQISDYSYLCPVCSHDEVDKEEFFKHLQNHKNEGFLFHKVNFNGDKIPLKLSDGNLFVDPSLEVNALCQIFKLNLELFRCTSCDEQIESRSLAMKHLKGCTLNGEVKSKLYIKHTCPVCQHSFLNAEEDKYISHLMLHKEENILYVKVDNTFQPAEVASDDQLFIPHTEAVKINKILSSNVLVKSYHVFDVNSCSCCDYVAESYDLLSEHCRVVHDEVLKEPSIICPVCGDNFNVGSVDECKAKYYRHLLIHRRESVVFVEMKNNGSVSSPNHAYSYLFKQSSILGGLANASLSICFPKVWHPELIVYGKIEENPYKCDICKKLFSSKQDIAKHIECHETKYICERCGKTFSGSKKYANHILMHLNNSKKLRMKPTCSVCNKRFANRASLNGHLKHHASDGVKAGSAASLFGIMCEKCGKSFQNSSSLSKHKKIHTTDKENTVLKCQICCKDFSRQPSFDRHKSAHLNPKYLECEICRLPLSSSISLEKHMEQHKVDSKTYDCKSCKLSFLSKDALTAHQTHTGHYADRKPIECNVCHEKFYLSRKFTQHIRTHPKYKIGECTLCGKRLATAQSLTLHMGRHFEANSILCPYCGKQYFEERNYHRHLMTHKGVKPFACDVENCGKSFYTFFELNRHKKYHLNKRDFGCSFCSKTFHEANHLTVHIRTHTGERPYTCPHCSKSFITRSRCKQHIKLIHQGIGYDMIQSSISKKVTVFENEQKTLTVEPDIE